MPHDDPDHPHALLPPEPALRVKALETVLIRKGLIDPAALDEIIDTYQNRIGPQNGARVVAKAWTDPEFKSGLLKDATPLVADLGYYGRQGEHMVVVENTPQQHNMVVCTLCSCYPWPLLGIPPSCTSPTPIAPAQCASRERSWQSSACACRPRRRYACGIRRPRCAISSCRCGHRAPRG